MKEETVVASSVILNLYNDAENLLTYTGTYITQFQNLYASYRNLILEKSEAVPEEEVKPLRDLSNTIKILVYRTYVRAKTLSSQIGTSLPADMEKSFNKLIGTKETRNLVLIFPPDLLEYVEKLFEFVTSATIQDLLGTARQVFKELGV